MLVFQYVWSSLYYFGYWYFQALSLSRTRGLKSPNSYEIAYDKYRESLSCPHPSMHDNIVYLRSHRLAIWRYEKWPYRPTLEYRKVMHFNHSNLNQSHKWIVVIKLKSSHLAIFNNPGITHFSLLWVLRKGIDHGRGSFMQQLFY